MKMVAICLVVLLLPGLLYAGGGPSLTAAQRREQGRLEARQKKLIQRWRRLGTRAIPTLIKVVFGCKYARYELEEEALDLLGRLGRKAIEAIHRTKIKPCAHGLDCDDEKTGKLAPCPPPTRAAARAKVLGALYCTGRIRLKKRAVEAWGRLLVDRSDRRHRLALRVFRQAAQPPPPGESAWDPLTGESFSCRALCDAPGLVRCDREVLHALTPDLIRLLKTTPTSNAALRQAIVRAMGAGANPAAAPVLKQLYRARDMRREVTMSLGHMGAASRGEILDFLKSAASPAGKAAALYALDRIGFRPGPPLPKALRAAVRQGVKALAALKLDLHRRDAWNATAPDAVLWYAVALLKRAPRAILDAAVARLLLRVIRSPAVGRTRHEAARLMMLRPGALTPGQKKCARDVLAMRGMPPDRSILTLMRTSTPGPAVGNLGPPRKITYDSRRVSPGSCRAGK